MLQVVISRSSVKDKKYDATIDGKKTIHFGASGYPDQTTIKNVAERTESKGRYIKRHRKNEDWNNPMTAGFYAKNILWNKSTIGASVADTNRRFSNLHITFKS
jgi:hypothetical protein